MKRHLQLYPVPSEMTRLIKKQRFWMFVAEAITFAFFIFSIYCLILFAHVML